MKKKTKRILIIAGTALIGVVILLNLSSQREKSIKATVEKVGRKNLTSIISASGEIKPKKNINLSAQIPGRIIKIGVQEGQEVKHGDFLLGLDPSQYEANADHDRAFIQSSQAERIKVEATLAKNKSYYERQQNLYDNQLISQEQLEQAKVQWDISEASLKAIDFQIDQARASLKSSLDNLSKTVFSAPIDGIITSLRVEEGEVAIIGTMNNPGTVLMTIADLSVMEVEVEVDETDVVGVVLGQTADVKVDAFPNQVFKGQVTEIGSSALQKSTVTSTTQESKDFKVVVTLANPSPGLKPGLSASADIITAQKDNVPAIPISALVVRDKVAAAGEPASKSNEKTEEGVFLVENERAKFVPVQKGIMGELSIEIAAGLTEGQTIVTGPYDTLRVLKDGDLIKPEVKKDEVKK
ncbi:MAG: efflux RND transporter periplasmic adaptor subunit [Candidatus Aminicenantes bacterium]|nr:efflux RND transporter periplasmic adaptor subunit [Candidatus Aminicenantes bacterium]